MKVHVNYKQRRLVVTGRLLSDPPGVPARQVTFQRLSAAAIIGARLHVRASAKPIFWERREKRGRPDAQPTLHQGTQQCQAGTEWGQSGDFTTDNIASRCSVWIFDLPPKRLDPDGPLRALSSHLHVLAPAFEDVGDIDNLARFQDAVTTPAGRVPADHGLQVGAEPARTHPVALLEHLRALRRKKQARMEELVRLWARHDGPLNTPREEETRIWDLFLRDGKQSHKEFVAACNSIRARVVSGHHVGDDGLDADEC
jgi:hypothetical protein